MNLEELQTVQSKERQKDSLQNLRPSFYRDVGEYISELEDERERVAERADDPFSSPEVARLTDEIEAAKDVVEAIYERRMGKLVKQASLAAAGMPADDGGLTAEEQDLFTDLVDRIQSNKNRVLDVLEGEMPAMDEGDGVDSGEPETGAGSATSIDPVDDTPPAPPEPEPDEERPTGDRSAVADPEPDAGISAADVMGGKAPQAPDDGEEDPSPPDRSSPEAPPEPPAPDGDGSVPSDTEPVDDAEPGDDVDRITVRITRDVGSILGVDDREYTLESDDVVTLPEQNATPLVERDAAQPLE